MSSILRQRATAWSSLGIILIQQLIDYCVLCIYLFNGKKLRKFYISIIKIVKIDNVINFSYGMAACGTPCAM